LMRPNGISETLWRGRHKRSLVHEIKRFFPKLWLLTAFGAVKPKQKIKGG
jgi:hypothetical protein